MKSKELREFKERAAGIVLGEALIDRLEKFAGKSLKPGRETIKGYPVDIEDSDGKSIYMVAVDKDSATGLVKELRKVGFKAKADKKSGIMIGEVVERST